MPRIARIVVPGAWHHITQRGNGQQNVFLTDEDRRVYLGLLRENAMLADLVVYGYCLMTNHVHAVGVPAREDSLTITMGRTSFLYAQYFNRKHRRSGHLWQGRFFSCAMDDAHGHAALCYVELNPVRAGMVRRPWDYRWSSAAAHCGERARDSLLNLSEWLGLYTPQEWRAHLTVAAPDSESDDALRRATRTGRPHGSEEFVSKAKQ